MQLHTQQRAGGHHDKVGAGRGEMPGRGANLLPKLAGHFTLKKTKGNEKEEVTMR